jgi:hypothetical protein
MANAKVETGGAQNSPKGAILMTVSASPIARDYVQLALAIGQHIPGYVDAYYGPPEWADQAKAKGMRPVDELVREASNLAAALADDIKMNSQQHDFLTRQVRAMQTSLRILQGEQLTLAEEAQALYDITPEWVDEAIFQEAHRTLDELLPAGDSLMERMATRRKATEVPLERVGPLLHEIIAELRRRAQARFPLPSDESFELQFVTDQPWRAYNWYLGHFHSRVNINTDLPLHITDLTNLIAHEGYPGHHTELSIKESQLVCEQGRIEHCVALINTPSCVVSEGIATRALSILMTDEEQIAWHAEGLFPRAGFSHLDARREHTITANTANFGKLVGVEGNAAFLLHDQGASEEEVVAYLRHYRLLSVEEARKWVDFLSNPLYRSYIFTYRYGGEMLDALFAMQDDRDHWFARLLTEPVTPSQIRSWTEG